MGFQAYLGREAAMFTIFYRPRQHWPVIGHRTDPNNLSQPRLPILQFKRSEPAVFVGPMR